MPQNVQVPVEAVIFDVGDVLEVNPQTGWPQRWARRLGIELDRFAMRLGKLWAQGSTGGSVRSTSNSRGGRTATPRRILLGIYFRGLAASALRASRRCLRSTGSSARASLRTCALLPSETSSLVSWMSCMWS